MSTSPFRDKGPVLNALRVVLRGARRLRLRLRLRSRFATGTAFSIGSGADVRPPGHFRVGDRVGIGKNLTVECDVDFADDVLISSNVSFVGNDHRFDDPAKTVFTQGRWPPACVTLEGDNLVGYGAIVIAPCRVGRGAIVAAGAVVKGDLAPYTIYAGVPARPLRKRFG